MTLDPFEIRKAYYRRLRRMYPIGGAGGHSSVLFQAAKWAEEAHADAAGDLDLSRYHELAVKMRILHRMVPMTSREIRVSRTHPGGGFWSYLGTDVVVPPEPRGIINHPQRNGGLQITPQRGTLGRRAEFIVVDEFIDPPPVPVVRPDDARDANVFAWEAIARQDRKNLIDKLARQVRLCNDVPPKPE